MAYLNYICLVVEGLKKDEWDLKASLAGPSMARCLHMDKCIYSICAAEASVVGWWLQEALLTLVVRASILQVYKLNFDMYLELTKLKT